MTNLHLVETKAIRVCPGDAICDPETVADWPESGTFVHTREVVMEGDGKRIVVINKGLPDENRFYAWNRVYKEVRA